MRSNILTGLLLAAAAPAMAQSTPMTPATGFPTVRTPPPTRDSNTPGYVRAKELPDGVIPTINDEGNFLSRREATDAAGGAGVGLEEVSKLQPQLQLQLQTQLHY